MVTTPCKEGEGPRRGSQNETVLDPGRWDDGLWAQHGPRSGPWSGPWSGGSAQTPDRRGDAAMNWRVTLPVRKSARSSGD